MYNFILQTLTTYILQVFWYQGFIKRSGVNVYFQIAIRQIFDHCISIFRDIVMTFLLL